jgi:succinate dehydrogenase hydrophobic anchor subunit
MALGAALVAVLVYLHGLSPALQTEFALRVALGSEDARALRWLIGAVLAQWTWIMLAVAAPALVLHGLTGVNLTRTDTIFCLGWAGACGCLGTLMLVGLAWRQRHRSLQMLGRVG